MCADAYLERVAALLFLYQDGADLFRNGNGDPGAVGFLPLCFLFHGVSVLFGHTSPTPGLRPKILSYKLDKGYKKAPQVLAGLVFIRF